MGKYRAFYDDGHDTGEFEYYSDYRRNSKKNNEDMTEEFKKIYGHKRYTQIKNIKCIDKIDE